MLTQKHSGLTLIEWLIVVAIIAILIIIIFVHINPLRERNRASDSNRKSDLNRIKIAMEDYYGDYDCYPTPAPGDLLPCGGDTDTDFRPYLGTIPCDPDTDQAYSYYPEDEDCPSYYRLYTNLRWIQDSIIYQLGCYSTGGCGPDGSYNYGVSSPNVGLEVWECPGNWYACQGENCDCNVVNSQCCYRPGETSPPELCSQSWPISECYCDDNTCGGKAS